MSSAPPQDDGPSETIRFRPGKKRKLYRQREDASTPAESSAATGAPARAGGDGGNGNSRSSRSSSSNDDDDDHVSAAAALRLRNARKARAGGVGFSATGSKADSSAGDAAGSHALVPSRAAPDGGENAVVHGITNRFTHQTGLLSSINDKHMTEYIESRLSRRSEPPIASASHTDDGHAPRLEPRNQPPSISASAGTARNSVSSSSAARSRTVAQPTRQGRLFEVDLSEVPTRRPPRHQHPDIAPAPKKQRLGPDGKPWRGRKRRASDDIKRDQLVEQFLHENRLDVYDTSQPENAIASTDAQDGDADGKTADDRLAEQFRKQYMDDVARRRQRRRPAQASTAATKNEDVLRGPKLGGSRNARAAVRNALLKKEKESRK